MTLCQWKMHFFSKNKGVKLLITKHQLCGIWDISKTPTEMTHTHAQHTLTSLSCKYYQEIFVVVYRECP